MALGSPRHAARSDCRPGRACFGAASGTERPSRGRTQSEAARSRAAAADGAVLRSGRLDRACRRGSIPRTWRDVIRAYQAACAEGGRAVGGPRRQVHGRRRARLFRLAAGARGRCRAGGARRARAGRRRSAGFERRRCDARGAGRHRHRPGRGRRSDRRGRRAEEAVVGETPNLAARLQALAQPGSVVISQATRRLIGGLFELDDLGPQRLKGFAEPLAAWRVAGEGRAEGRFEARQTRGPHAAGRARGGDRAAAAPLAAGQGRRGPGGAALGRARDRQVAPRARAARAARGRAPHPPALPVLAPPHDQPAAPGDRAAGARRRLRARRSARGQARQAGGAPGARHGQARSGGAADRGAARHLRRASATRCPS